MPGGEGRMKTMRAPKCGGGGIKVYCRLLQGNYSVKNVKDILRRF